MNQPLQTGAEGALDSLVSQFSSALDCFRELVQNSIDAGSHQVDVWLEHTAGAGGLGTTCVHVDDTGEGMDEAIIDSQLTQLFSSAKENDLTKIGKFGIGFVSVFALRPRAVLVHTGRGGEFWEVCFHEDRTFTKTRIDTPTEGTRISIYIEQGLADYRELVSGALATLRRWCVHSETEVYFEDRSNSDASGPILINEPFAVEGYCASGAQHQGTEIAIAFHPQPRYAFFNRGLTLFASADAEEALGDHAPRFEGITFKIKSRYLEHTLSRESILKDANYERAMALLLEAVHGPLRHNLTQTLVELARSNRLDAATTRRYFFFLRMMWLHYTMDSERRDETYLSSLHELPLLRTVTGEAVSFKALRKALRKEGRVYYAAHHSPVVAAIMERGCPVLLAPPAGVANPLPLLLGYHLRGIFSLQESVRQSVVDPHNVFYGLQLDPTPGSAVDRLIRAAGALLHEAGAGYRDVRPCALASGQPGTPLLLVSDAYRDTMEIPRGSVLFSHQRSRRVVAINQDHPEVRELLQHFLAHPGLAIYSLAKRVLLADGRRLDLDEALMRAAMAGRTHKGRARVLA